MSYKFGWLTAWIILCALTAGYVIYPVEGVAGSVVFGILLLGYIRYPGWLLSRLVFKKNDLGIRERLGITAIVSFTLVSMLWIQFYILAPEYLISYTMISLVLLCSMCRIALA